MKLKPIISFFICSLLIACTLPSYRHRNISVSIVEPLSGDIYFAGVPIDILANSYVDGANITERFFIFVNSNRIGEIPTPTFTPASDADCEPGTYFAENTNQCIPIEIVTVKPGKDNGGQNACKDPGNCPYCWSQQNCSCK